MYEVRVEAEFAAAHFIRDYNGKCENLHGHNYRVMAHVRGQKLDGGGMLFDFARLKRALRDACGELDHSNLNDIASFAQNPSAERIAEHIFKKILSYLPELSGTNPDCPTLHAVDVYETPTSRARFTAE